MSVLVKPDLFLGHEEAIIRKKDIFNSPRLTSFIITVSPESLTYIDIQNFIETGLRIIRFKMDLVKREENLKVLAMLDDALKSCCEKYEISSWPIAVSIDIPNAAIRTGLLDDSIQEDSILLKNQDIIELTCDNKYWNKCTSKRIFMDDSYTFPGIKVGTEISIRFGQIRLVCVEIVSQNTIKCEVRREGNLKSGDFLNLRGVKHLRPPMGKNDMDLLLFAMENKFDVIIVNCIRYATTIHRVKNYFVEANCRPPIIVATICDQEGLDNIDDIIKEADAIVLAREFLAYEIQNEHLMCAIQLHLSAKCRKLGIPIYISGSVLDSTLTKGQPNCKEITDLTNIVLQGSGLLLRAYSDPNYVMQAMRLLNSVSRTAEAVSKSDFWDLVMALRPPVNAAEACAIGCAILAKQTNSKVIVVVTVTGKSATLLTRLCPNVLILTISSDSTTARKLLFYRSIIPLIYTQKAKKNWYEEQSARIEFAVQYAVKHDMMKYGENYVTFRKVGPTSCFADSASSWKVVLGETSKFSLSCKEHPEIKTKDENQRTSHFHLKT